MGKGGNNFIPLRGRWKSHFKIEGNQFIVLVLYFFAGTWPMPGTHTDLKLEPERGPAEKELDM